MLTSVSTARIEAERFLQPDCDKPFLFIEGNSVEALQELPSSSVDTVLTSPPYWSQREYASASAIGGEATLEEYISSLLDVFAEVKRVLKPSGSLWLNIGDVYRSKNLCGAPWRVAIAMQDEQGWILRNSVIWHKLKGGPDNARDKLRNMHENVFHFVKQRSYYYDTENIRNRPHPTKSKDGAIVTATGVSGVNYRRQIQRSSALTEDERANALRALDETLAKVANGDLFDFRMVIRGQQRVTHSDSTKVSGRATELEKKGYYILPYDKRGSKPGDVWEIVPEDQWRTDPHFAPFPQELCTIPIQATCPPGGIVLDPFVGTGTAIIAAVGLGRRGIGIDITGDYFQAAEARLSNIQLSLLSDL